MKDKLGDRMKRYESVSDLKLVIKTPVIIRIDGKAFHTLTKTLDSPFDALYTRAMNQTMMRLVKVIPNIRFGYVQSDEISLCLLEPSVYSDAWFDNRVSKLCSIAAAEATLAFHQALRQELLNYTGDLHSFGVQHSTEKYQALLDKAVFDARAFNLPSLEVVNYFIWRQQDCRRNAVLSTGQHYFGQKGINRLQTPGIIQKLKDEKNFDFDQDTDLQYQLGRVCYRDQVSRPTKDNDEVLRWDYVLDCQPPVFATDRAYIEDCLEINN